VSSNDLSTADICAISRPALSPDGDALLQRTRLPHTRAHDDSRNEFSEQEVIVLSEEHDLRIAKIFTDSCVRSAAPAEGDDVIGRQAIRPQGAEESEWKILVEQDSHDACRQLGRVADGRREVCRHVSRVR
jgi:hypothetical protein